MIVVYLIFLAVIQAVTEFLPVSSLGHLCILEQYMGIGHETGLLSETMLHLGSAAAIIFLFRKDLKNRSQIKVGSRRKTEAGIGFALFQRISSI